MINIGKLRFGSTSYYLDTVAKNRTDYYLGRGEAAGRWVGSLASELGLAGTVEDEAFDRLLLGLDPHSGEALLSAAGCNARARARTTPPPALPGRSGEALSVAQVAAQLEVTPQAVRLWLEAGERVREVLAAGDADEAPQSTGEIRARAGELRAHGGGPDLPRVFLLGIRSALAPGARGGRPAWAIPQEEVTHLRRHRRPPDAQAGWDLVFRPPKSYSVLWAVGGPEIGKAIEAIHHEAVEHALAYLEDVASRARVTVGTTRRRRVRAETKGLVGAAFDHRDSRAGDPLLHTHCVVPNLTRLPDGNYVALDPRGLYRHGLAADAVYQATLRHQAERRLGLEAEPVVNGWADIDGVPREVIEHFSKRSTQIAEATATAGSDSPAARQAAALATRAPKSSGCHDSGLHQRWKDEAESLGFDAAAVARCLGRAEPRPLEPTVLDRLFDRLSGPSGLTQTSTTFTRAQVIRTLACALGPSVDGVELVHLADRFLGSERVVALDEHRSGQPKARVLATHGQIVADLPNATYTTPEIVAIEHRLMDLAHPERHQAAPAATQAVIAAVLAGRPALTAEQRTMVEALGTSTQTLRAAVGHPGSGKTYAIEALVAVLADSGVPVVGCAVTAEAADELARATQLERGGLGLGCDTIAKLLLDLDDPEAGGLPERTVVIVDEASMASHRDLAALATHVSRASGALVLVGDPRQHAAVGPGHFFGWLVEHLGPDCPVLQTNQRQRDALKDGRVVRSLAEERLANVEYREGKIAEALARRDAAGLVVRAPTAEQLYDAMAADWLVGWLDGARDPMITTRNDVRGELNRRARLLRIAEGELDGPALTIAGRTFSVGEYVVARRNRRDLTGPGRSDWFVKNGSRGTITAIHAEHHELTVAFEGPDGTRHRVRLPHRYLTEGHLEWAYAVTDYGVQGRTLDRGLAVLDDATRVEGAYVALTRGRNENRAYVVDGRVAERQDDDIAHAPGIEHETSLDLIAEKLGSQAPDALVHEIDPSAWDAGQLARRTHLGELTSRLVAAEAALDDAPGPMDRRLRGAERRRDELMARRRYLITTLDDGNPGRVPVPADRRMALESELATIDAQVRRLHQRIGELRTLDAERAHYLETHHPELTARDALRGAVRAREARTRLAARDLAPPALRHALARLGPPSSREERRLLRDAFERVALFQDRHGPIEVPPDGHVEYAVDALGPRPADARAATAWDAAAAAVTRAQDALERSRTAEREVPVPEVPLP